MNTRDAARGKWRGILIHFGIPESFLKDVHGPCPLCRGTDRFRWDDDNGDGGFYCNQCGAGSGMRLLMETHGWTFSEAAKQVDLIIGNIQVAEKKTEQSADQKKRHMRQMFKESAPVVQGDPVWKYLESRCGDPSGTVDHLRYHPALKHSASGGTYPAMLALMWPHDSAKAVGIHRTYLTLDGRKAAVDPVRMSYGELAPVQLGPVMPKMGIAEGLETAICAGKAFGLSTWAAVSANGLIAWEPPSLARSVVVFSDNDASFTGQHAAYELGKRLKHQGLEVEIQIPREVGTDWADGPRTWVA